MTKLQYTYQQVDYKQDALLIVMYPGGSVISQS
jgi:hypothetical protein